MRKLARTVLPALLVGSLAATGCGGFHGLTKPDVAVVGLRITDVNALASTAIFEVKIDNPNPQPVYLEGSVHRVKLNSEDIGRGLIGEPMELEPFGTLTVPVEISFSNLRVADRLRTMIERRRMDYEVKSELHAVIDGERAKAKVSKKGRLDLDGLVRTR